MRWIIVSIVVAACGTEPAPSETARQSCEKYREHLLDVRLRGVSEHREEHRAALRATLGDDFVADCEQTRTQADLDCAMAATTTEQLRRCSSQR
jgi:hypothetical protein